MGITERFKRLVSLGPKVKCSRTGTYLHWAETNDDGKGGRIDKKHDVYVHDQYTEVTRQPASKGYKTGGNI
jgi:hypothetical protein